MNDEELATLIKTTLFDIAPDIEGEPMDFDVAFREQFEIDSMDFLNFVIGLHNATGIDIPEADYPKLETLGSCVCYLKKQGVGS
jgi:acyl carrier protein